MHRIELTDPVTPEAPPKTYELAQTFDTNGFPHEYSLSFVTHVCNDNQCLPVAVTMVWNAAGYFERLTYPPGKPLTKTDHVPFTPEDYAKLDRILKDRKSILATWALSFLEKPVEEMPEGVDGMTGPTPATVQDAVIQEAAYTSWALWHWANGKIVPKLKAITERSCTPKYLNHLLVSKDRRFADFAMDYVTAHQPSDAQFVDSAVHILENGERDQITRALDFLYQAIPDREKLHARLIESCCRIRPADCPLILQKLAAEPDLSATTLEGLTAHLSEFPFFPIHLILRMLEERKFASEKTISDVVALLDGDDFFIARRAAEHLAKQDLSAAMQSKLDAFREKNRDRL